MDSQSQVIPSFISTWPWFFVSHSLWIHVQFNQSYSIEQHSLLLMKYTVPFCDCPSSELPGIAKCSINHSLQVRKKLQCMLYRCTDGASLNILIWRVHFRNSLNRHPWAYLEVILLNWSQCLLNMGHCKKDCCFSSPGVPFVQRVLVWLQNSVLEAGALPAARMQFYFWNLHVFPLRDCYGELDLPIDCTWLWRHCQQGLHFKEKSTP